MKISFLAYFHSINYIQEKCQKSWPIDAYYEKKESLQKDPIR